MATDTRNWFDLGKAPCYCEGITHTTEKRKDGEVKVIVLTLRLEPFDPKWATALDTRVRNSLYRLSTTEPFDHIRRLDFVLGSVRQHLDIYTTPDTNKPKLRIEHTRIVSAYARAMKDARGFALVFKVAFGPPSARELEYVEHWRNNMAFITFLEAEHDEMFDLVTHDEEGDDVDAGDDGQTSLGLEGGPEFETDPAGKPIDEPAAAGEPEPARQKLLRHADGRKRGAGADQPSDTKKVH